MDETKPTIKEEPAEEYGSNNSQVYSDQEVKIKIEDNINAKTELIERVSSRQNMYKDHQIKEDIVIGPTELQQAVTFTAQPVKKELIEEVRSIQNQYVDHIFKESIAIGPTHLQLQDSLQQPPNSKAYPCGHCNKIFKRRKKLRKHLEKEHNKSDDFDTISCGICFNYFASLDSLQKHMKYCLKMKNPNYENYLLKNLEHVKDEFDETNNNKNVNKLQGIKTEKPEQKIEIKNENMKDKNNIKNDKTDKTFTEKVCPICFKQFTLANNLNRHMNVCHSNNIKPFSCNMCDHKCMRKDYLVRHKFAIHSINEKKKGKIPCKCGKSFSTIHSYEHHKNGFCVKHTRGELYACDYCNKNIDSKPRLIEHIRYHTRLRKTLICDYCGKSYHKKWELTRHILKHLDVSLQRYQCQICKQKFTRRFGLKKHMIAHSGRKPFSCNYCGRDFRSKWGCVSHERHHCPLKR